MCNLYLYLDRVDGKIEGVVDDDIVRGGHGALADMLRHQEEVVEVPLGDGVVENGSGRRVVQLLADLVEDPGVDPLLDHDEAEARVVFVADVPEAVAELLRLVSSRQ